MTTTLAATMPFDQELLKSQLADLVDMSGQEQSQRLSSLDATHPQEARQLRSLLGFVANTAPNLRSPGALLGQMNQASLPSQIGPWEVLGELGRGGMGVVLRAKRSDGVFDKQVAIKVLPPVLSGGEAGERFVQEARLLAPLDHPHIARLMDAGVSQGCAYFVMDLVEGITLTAHAKPLPLKSRLTLFLQLCSAVGFAHGRLLVHRDIKPANVLVDALGQVRLLDFGIAKLLSQNEATLNAQASGQAAAFTPAYASPEQLTGEPAAVTSDVFSLGVLLYELCTGEHPYLASGGETARQTAATMFAILERNPAREPLHRSGVSFDLQSVILKALEKDPARRYSSVDALSADVEAFMAGMPVKAQPATWRYQASRFVARHRGAVSAAAITSATILGLSGWSLYSAQIAREQSALAQKRLVAVREIANKVVFDYNRALEPISGTLEVRKLLVSDALGYLAAQQSDAGDDLALGAEIARGYEAVGDVQGRGVTKGNLGELAAAGNSYSKALEIRQAICAQSPKLSVRGDEAVTVPACAALANALARQGDNQFSRGQLAPAIASFEQARAANARVLASDQAWSVAELDAVTASQFLVTSKIAGLSTRQTGDDFAKGLPMAVEQLALAKKMALGAVKGAHKGGDDSSAQSRLRDSHDFLAYRLLAAGQAQAARVEIDQAVELARLGFKRAANADTAIALASSLSNQAEITAHLLQFDAAEASALASLELMRSWHLADPKNAFVRARYANIGARTGHALNLIGSRLSHATALRLLTQVAQASSTFTPTDGVFWVQHQRVLTEGVATALALGDLPLVKRQLPLLPNPPANANPRAALDAAPAQLLRAKWAEQSGELAQVSAPFELAYKALQLQAQQTPANASGLAALASACRWATTSKALAAQRGEYAECAAKAVKALQQANALTPLARQQLVKS